jgi:hypothetical protein
MRLGKPFLDWVTEQIGGKLLSRQSFPAPRAAGACDLLVTWVAHVVQKNLIETRQGDDLRSPELRPEL